MIKNKWTDYKTYSIKWCDDINEIKSNIIVAKRQTQTLIATQICPLNIRTIDKYYLLHTMKLVISFVTISVAAAASQDGSFIRGSADDSAAAATHVVPTDIFAGLENSPNNNFTPQQYCPRGTSYNSNGPEWPAEDGCYP